MTTGHLPPIDLPPAAAEALLLRYRVLEYARMGEDLRIVVGGRAFASAPGLWREIGADGQGRDLDEAIATFRQFSEPAPAPP